MAPLIFADAATCRYYARHAMKRHAAISRRFDVFDYSLSLRRYARFAIALPATNYRSAPAMFHCCC